MPLNIHRHFAVILLVLITVALSIGAMQTAHAQTFPWSMQAELVVDPGGGISFRKIEAPDTLHAMALGFGGPNNVVCRTTNGGASWDIPLQRWDMEDKLQDISYPTPRVAVVVGDTTYRAIDTGSAIFYTHDGGDTWQQGWCDSCVIINQSGTYRYPQQVVALSDSANGIIASGKYLLARTTDGGATWRRIPTPALGDGEFFDRAQCLSPAAWFLSTERIGSTNHPIYRTYDTGRTWEAFPFPPYTRAWTFIDSLRGWCAASWNVDSATGPLKYMIFRTLDGGRTWDTIYSRYAERLGRGGVRNTFGYVGTVSMADATHGLINCYYGGWLYTADGTTWTEGPNIDSVLNIYDLACMTYPHPNKAWAAGYGPIVVYDRHLAAVPDERGVATVTLAAFPNPITSGIPVTLSITIPHVEPGTNRVRLSLVDLRGSTVATIEHPIANAGTYHLTWLPPASLSTGTYFLRLASGSTVTTIPISVLR